MKVGIIQLAIDDSKNKREKLNYVGQMIDGLRGTDLVVLPEVWNLGFFAFEEYRAQSEPLQGETISFLSSRAAENDCYIFTGSHDRAAGRPVL